MEFATELVTVRKRIVEREIIVEMEIISFDWRIFSKFLLKMNFQEFFIKRNASRGANCNLSLSLKKMLRK